MILSLQNGRVLAGGRASTADGILALAGVRNAADGLEGFKPMGDEAIIASAPDAVVMMRTGHGDATADSVFAQPALAQTPPGRTAPSSPWTGSCCSASARAPRRPRAS